jgi:hypothetical protein
VGRHDYAKAGSALEWSPSLAHGRQVKSLDIR